MEQWRKDARREVAITDIEGLVPEDHLLRKIEKVMDYEWLYERLEPYYCHNNGRPETDPQPVEKAAKPLFRERLHGGRGSFSYEKVTPSTMRSVISDAHVAGNDGFSFDSCGCGRRNSARLSFGEGFSTP